MQDKNWFTVEPIDRDTFAISEWKHWEETHCYLLCGSDRALLIDTGLGVSDIKQVVDSLTSLPIQVVTTHVHWTTSGATLISATLPSTNRRSNGWTAIFRSRCRR